MTDQRSAGPFAAPGSPVSASIDLDDVASLGNVDEALAAFYNRQVADVADATGVGERAIRRWIETELISELVSLVPADVGLGTSTTRVINIATVYTGIDQTQPCPVCSGADIGDSGTCSGGDNNGDPCTTDATHPAFGNTSYDCPPSAGAGSTPIAPACADWERMSTTRHSNSVCQAASARPRSSVPKRV